MESKRGRQLLALALGSLTKTKEWEPTETLFEFLDDCFARLPKRAVKYHQDLLKQAAAIHHHLKPVGEYLGGELLMVVMEQWPFMQESAKPADLENITCWLSRFLLVAKRNGVDPELLEHIRSRMKSITSDKECRKLLKGSFKDQIDDRLSVELEQPDIPALPPPMVSQNEISKQEQDRGDVWTPPTPPGSEDENHPGLGKWKQLEVEEAIVEGAIGDLVLCLCSKFPDIRKQALNELRAWMKKLQVRLPHVVLAWMLLTVTGIST